MLKRRTPEPTDAERELAAAITAAGPPVSDCRPGIRGRCSIPGCPRCDPPAQEPESK